MPLNDFERSLREVAETLRNAGDRGCSLLIGAGCSATSDIPLAGGIVREFEKRYPERYARVKTKTYPHCMAQLAYNERSRLIASFIDNAKINWAHLAIAQLMKAGYVTRILTTNFDPLVVKACATVGVFPAVYDLAASQQFMADRVYEPSVFYLHGQRAGFVTLHTEDEVTRHKQTLGPVFEDAGKGRNWIVCGYSGENDPVFDHLANVTTFGCPLYWVGYEDTPPSADVQTRLLTPNRFAYYVRGYDADSFFVELARELECFPPDIVAKPFSHLLAMTDLLAEFKIGESSTNLRQTTRSRIQAAIDQFEQGEIRSPQAENLQPSGLDATTLLLSGKYDEVLALFASTPNPSEELRDAAAWATIVEGVGLHKRAMEQPEADALLEAAGEKYEAALRIKPNMPEALFNWGLVFTNQAETKSGEQAKALWDAAGEKYAAAVRFRPDYPASLENWSNVLLRKAALATPDMRETLLASAIEKCHRANELEAGAGSYNLACAYGIRGDTENCRKWLLDSKKHGKLPKRAHLLNDPDLASVREQPWFAELVAPQ